MSSTSQLDILAPLKKGGPKKLIRKPVLKKPSNAGDVATASSLQKIHDESERRLSSLLDTSYDKARRATIRHLDTSSEANLNGVLEKVRQNSIKVPKVDVAAATKSIASQFAAVLESDLLTESLNAIVNRLGQGNEHFENSDLSEYVRIVFKKSKFETDKLITKLQEQSGSAHTLQILLERASLKRSPKSSAFCSLTIKRKHDPIQFALCNENNTVLSTLCGSPIPVWDATLYLPLETTRGFAFVAAVWETRTNATIATVNEAKKCMGLVEIDLNSQPTTGSRESWTLKSKKPGNMKKKGEIYLGLTYNAGVGRHSNAVMVHAGMLSKFLSVDYPKSGCLSGIAAHILELQKIQQQLSIEEFRFADWLVRAELYVKTNSHYELLYRTLLLLLECLEKKTCALSPEHLVLLYKTFTDFLSKYIEKMSNLNGEFPHTTETACVDLKYFTKCYLALVQCSKYRERHSAVIIHSKQELEAAFKSNTLDWLNSLPFKLDGNESLVDMTKKTRDMTNTVRIELRNESRTYAPALEGTSFDVVSLYEINEKISNDTVRVVGKTIAHLKNRPLTEESEEAADEDLLHESLSLYVAVAELKKLSYDMLPRVEHALGIFHTWFFNIIENWLQMVQWKQKVRVAKAVEYDKIERMDMHIYYSTSVVDVETMNQHLCEIQETFDFPDEASRYSVISKLNRQVVESIVQLSELLLEKGEALLQKGTKKYGDNKMSPEDLLKKSLVVMCSLNEARRKLRTLPLLLNWHKFTVNTTLVEKLGCKQREGDETTLKYKLKWMKRLCETLIEPKFVEAFNRFINLAYKRDKTAVEELLKMLEEQLNQISVNVESHLFEELLKVIWERVVLPRFQQHIETRPAKIQAYYDILQESFQELCDFFLTEVPSLQEHITQNMEYRRMLYILQNLTIPLEELLFRYFVEEMLQEDKQRTTLGCISYTAFYTRQNDKILLKVGVLNCIELPTMDTLGACDAMVKVTLQPHQADCFKHLKIHKTRVIKNTLEPTFNQQFDLSFYTENLDDIPDGACLQLSVWDKDNFSADDFIGETLVDLKSIPFDSPETYKRALALPDLKCASYDVISHRGPYENVAIKFIKERGKLDNQVGEDFILSRGSATQLFTEMSKRLSKNLF